MDEMEEIRGFFIEEAEELFENISTILLESEQNGELSEDDITRLFRDIHTLKGGSGSVELGLFAGYIHHLEDFIDSLRNGEFESTPDIINFLIEEQDNLIEIIHEEIDGTLDRDMYQQKKDLLLQKVKRFSSDDGVKESQIIENNFNIEEYNVDFADMYSILLKKVTNASEDDFEDINFIAEVFRELHTLKGSSSFLGLLYFPKYLHDLETLLDKARDGKIEYTEKFNEAVIATLKVSEEIAFEEFSDNFKIESFAEKLDQMSKLFKDVIEADDEDEDVGFEIFEAPKEEEEEEDVGFEIFEAPKEEEEEEDVGFEIFETPKEEDVKKEQNPKISNVSQELSPPVKESIKVQEKPDKKTPEKVKKKSKKIVPNSSIRVGLDKIDFLMNRVGDLVITKSMLYKFLQDLSETIENPSIVDRLDRLDREIRELQEAVMAVRMIPMESVYAKLPKIIRDLAKKLDKKVNFVHIGDTVEIDKLMVEGLTDPLTHIIRNSLDHGIETPSDRLAKGKSETGTVTITAAQESGLIVISIEDDGAGINTERVLEKALENGVISEKEAGLMSEEDKAMLIFNAGLSTAEKVSEVSGRGVGMDVVMTNISSLGGSITIKTFKDKGSKITILLPLTLAILDGLNVLVGNQQLIMPLNMIVESLQPAKEMIKRIGDDQKEILMLRNEFIPIIRLHKFFNIKTRYMDIDKGMLIVTKIANMKAAIFVDDFLNQEQIVVKSLEKNYKKIVGISAATIRGDGNIGLILDIMNIIENEKATSWNS